MYMGKDSYDVAFCGSRLLHGYQGVNNDNVISSLIPVGIDLDEDAFNEIRKDFCWCKKCEYSIDGEIHSLFLISRIDLQISECCSLVKRFGFNAFVYHAPKQTDVCVYDCDGNKLECFGSDDGFDKMDYLDSIIYMVEYNVGKSIEFKSLYEWVIDNSATSLVAHHFNDKFVTGWKTAISRYDDDNEY